MPHQELAMLERVGGLDLVRAVVAAFVKTIPERLAESRHAVERGDARALAVAVHSLKSSCLQLGAAAVGRACEAVESEAGAGRLQGAAAALDGIERDLVAFQIELDRAVRRIGDAPRRI